MKCFVALVINLVVLVQIAQSHTIPPTIILAEKSEPNNDVGLQVNQDDNNLPEVTQPEANLNNTWYDIEEEKTEPDAPATDDTSKEDELVFAHVMYRHGERDIPKHIELTNEGKMHLYQLGQYFHKRYGKLIGDGYQQDKVYVLSTDHDRAIMSAQANLAGMFEPNDTEKWHQHILWQPIPVHTLPMVLDNILRPRYEDRCPRYDKMYNWYIKKSPEATEMYNKYGHLFDFWAKQTGKKVKHIEHVFSIYKKLLSQKQQNQTIPEWAEEACAPGGPMEEIAKVVYALRAKPDLVRIRSGFLLKEMLERFKAKKKGKLEPDRALYMYSAHSSTITTLLNGLGFNLPIPEHGFSFHFEMYKTRKDKYYLQLFLRQPGDENPKPEEIKDCGTKCSLRKFYKIYDKLIPDEFEVECGVKKPKDPKPEEPDRTDKPEKDTTTTSTPTPTPTSTSTSTTTTTTTPRPTTPPTKGGNNASALKENGLFPIVLCSLWFIHKFIS